MSAKRNGDVMQRSFAKSARVTSLLWLVGVGACTSVLGIEDLHEGPKPGSETNGGEGGSETTNVKGGSKNGGSTNGGSTNGGSTNGGSDAGAGNVGPGGEGGTMVTPIGGEAGVGGEGGAPFVPKPVNGKLINQWGMPVGNVTVQIGATQATTGDDGKFTIPDVGATYELSLINGYDGWVFQGLHRHNPTLQVISADPDLSRSSKVSPSFTNAVKGTNDQIMFAVGAATGNNHSDDLDLTDTPDWNSIYCPWLGSNATPATAHALQWTLNATTKLPASYKAYDSKDIALADAGNTDVSFDLKADMTLSKPISGSATAAGNADPSNVVLVHFSSGAWLKLLDATLPKAKPAFSYLVPEIANSSITVMTYQGSFAGEVGMVHKNGHSPGDILGEIKAPRPATLLTPAPNQMDVESTANFSFTPSAENSGAFMYVFNPPNEPGRLFIVTAQTTLKGLPSVLDGAWVLPKASEMSWWVETHGSFSNVDDMASPAGFIDMFGLYYDYEKIGPGDEDGSWTSSESHTFWTK